jgi:uncharacterized protein
VADEHASIRVRVTPRAGSDAVFGLHDGELAVRVTAAPDDGKANAAVCRVVARFLGVPKTAVTVRRGATSRHKTLDVAGVAAAEVDRAISERFSDEA